MTSVLVVPSPIFTRGFVMTCLVNALWINASEVFRYFALVMPMLREAFPQIENIAPMNLTVFAIWGLWDTILVFFVTFFVWLYLERFGGGVRNALIAGTFVWLGVFGILWLGMFNMNLATLEILTVALLLSWIELGVAACIVNWGMKRLSTPRKLLAG